MNQLNRWPVWVIFGLGLLLLPFLIKDFRVFQLSLMLIYAIALLGLNILTGYGGQISLGHGAFYAIGGYYKLKIPLRSRWHITRHLHNR